MESPTINGRTMLDLNKKYQSYKFANGGLMLGMCTHGIVYYWKPLIRQESPRDVVDGMRCFKFSLRLLSMTIYPASLPILGRTLAESTTWPPGATTTAWSFLTIHGGVHGPRRCELWIDYWLGASHSFGFSDRFHQTNSKKPMASLRCMSLINSFRGLDSQICEQQNSMLKKKLPSHSTIGIHWQTKKREGVTGTSKTSSQHRTESTQTPPIFLRCNKLSNRTANTLSEHKCLTCF